MIRCSRSAMLAVLSMLCCAAAASAETLRCQSVNGNLNCAGSGGVSCQVVDGRKVCSSSHGDVVQSFGNGGSSGGDTVAGDDGEDAPAIRQHIERRDSRGRTLRLGRDATRLHLQTDWLSLHQD
jgi:hypothetical protein